MTVGTDGYRQIGAAHIAWRGKSALVGLSQSALGRALTDEEREAITRLFVVADHLAVKGGAEPRWHVGRRTMFAGAPEWLAVDLAKRLNAVVNSGV